MQATLEQLAHAVSAATDLEALSRPILELLEAVTGMESTYLTTVDLVAGQQHILYARNTRAMTIPEGLSVDWDDTLCKRALEEERPYTDDVPGIWGDSAAARALGIQTYLSHPVQRADGALYGTLCAASADRHRLQGETLNLLSLFARLIAHQVEREQAIIDLRRANESLSAESRIDALTGVINRRGLMPGLREKLQTAERHGHPVHVLFIDLDGFKAINDTHGHDVGDRFLMQVAQRLGDAVRAGDLVARYGGDEFVVVTTSAQPDALRDRLQRALSAPFEDRGLIIAPGGGSIGLTSAEAGEVDAERVLARADASMYLIKKTRRSARSH
ncbi:sensor domain-containing diguanylate cyclase [Algiphilus sp. NNCM1]|uniref:GGDEF domain-containing protein n=1 Tax=Algiphilus sp. TaxID=1872431 RepID=UPI001CA65472|nr:sensor domain-containing diguanylate cyclase [Algiphilus sp.]MBY8964648.1 sensor domain-containing diguanylate cyclase [Algiphilus acroporae]MCI5061584.1 sensor domain-containing diguanylate cyclase [Algiphilus sp.]MCI5104843.1 sensor domain-containing diguanylate cyclase [Algiphilus sp.]